MLPVEKLSTEFEESLEDFVLSKSEKRAIKKELQAYQISKADIFFLNSALKKMAAKKMAEGHTEAVLEWLFESQKVLLNLSFDKYQEEDPRVAFSPGYKCLHEIMYVLKNARNTIDICVFTISDDRIFEVMADAHKRGIKIRVITDNDKQFDLGSDIDKMKAIGIPVKIDCSTGHMHHKFAVVDNEVLLTGSYNWTRSAAFKNYENVMSLKHKRTVSRFSKQFEELWEKMDELN